MLIYCDLPTTSKLSLFSFLYLTRVLLLMRTILHVTQFAINGVRWFATRLVPWLLLDFASNSDAVFVAKLIKIPSNSETALPAKGKTLHFSLMTNWNILFHYYPLYYIFPTLDLIVFLNILISKTQVSKIWLYAQCAKLIHALGKLSWKLCGKIFHPNS